MKLPKISIVIGANYGDEGKGLVTNALAKDKDTLVILTNGGSQRGHTVVQDGIRHVFHHFGSGTLKSARTYCADTFIVNPITFMEEFYALKNFERKRVDYSKNPLETAFLSNVSISENCRITTIYDMLANKIRCLLSGRNDSTGYGIWETIQRYEANPAFFRYGEFVKKGGVLVAAEMHRIRDYYLAKFADLLKETPNDNSELRICLDLYLNPNLEANFYTDLDEMIDNTNLITKDKEYDWVIYYNNWIFEQGQGLAINLTDKEFGTPSYTDSTLPIQFLQEMFKDDFDKLEIKRYYVTRSYLTRHGDGVFSADEEFGKKFDDKTNIYNEYQGGIKYAPFDRVSWMSMLTRIFKDYYKNSFKINNEKNSGEFNLVITHLNEQDVPYNEFNHNGVVNINFTKIFGSFDETEIKELYNKLDTKSVER